MIVDLRTYTCVPGKMQEWLALYEKLGWPLQQKYLGRCLGFYTTLEGRLNKVVHLWAYDSQADREARRGAMAQDPAWKVFVDSSAKLGAMMEQENTFMRPVPFFDTSSST